MNYFLIIQFIQKLISKSPFYCIMHSKNIATVNKPRSIERETLLLNSKDFN